MTILAEKAIAKKLEDLFGKRLDSVLGYGSFFSNSDGNFSDVDLVIVLDKYRDDDCESIRDARLPKAIGLPLSPLILYKENILPDGIFFSANTCGPFFLRRLKEARVLFGSNPFIGILEPGKLIVDVSLLQKIQQYNYQLKTEYFNLLDNQFSAARLYLQKKRIRMMLLDLQTLTGDSVEQTFGAEPFQVILSVTESDPSPKELIKASDLIYFEAQKHIKKTYC